MGELVKKYASEDDSFIYDLTEYLDEPVRLLNGKDGAFDATELRQILTELVGNL